MVSLTRSRTAVIAIIIIIIIEKYISHSSKTFNIFTTKDSCTWNVTRNTGGTAV
jgi:hypothetical protein